MILKHAPLFLLSALAALLLAGCRRQSPGTAPQAGAVRIVSLAPSITEIVCAAGGLDALVGRTSACNHPPEIVPRVPVIGGFGAPSIEQVVAARPTLILEADLADETIGNKLDEIGLRRVRVRCSQLDDVPAALRTVGSLLGRPTPANELATTLEARVAELRTQAAGASNPPRVFVEIWNDPVMTVGRTSFVAELVRLAGGRNIGDDSDTEYFQVSPEWVVAKDPQIILCLYMAKAGSAKDTVLTRPGWSHTTAIREGRVFDGLNNDILLRPGPRVLDGIAELRRCIGGKASPP